MALGTIAAAASGVGAIGSLIGQIGQNKRNKRLMNHSHNLNKQMFDYQNAYNTPAKQMERLKKAGLNPALMYGQGTTGNASQAPYTSPPTDSPADFSGFSNGITSASQMLLDSQQINNLKANQKEVESRTMLNTIEASVKAGTKEEAKGLVRYQLENLKNENKTKLQNLANLKISNQLLNKGLTQKQIEIENAKIQKALNQSDLDFIKNTGLYRQDSPLLKLLWRASGKGVDTFSNLLKALFGSGLQSAPLFKKF